MATQQSADTNLDTYLQKVFSDQPCCLWTAPEANSSDWSRQLTMKTSPSALKQSAAGQIRWRLHSVACPSVLHSVGPGFDAQQDQHWAGVFIVVKLKLQTLASVLTGRLRTDEIFRILSPPCI